MTTTDTEREIVYVQPDSAGNAVANTFLGLLVFALLAFLVYYVAVMVPAANAPVSSTVIQRDVERQVVVPAPTSTAPSVPDTTTAPVTPPVNSGSTSDNQ